MRSLACALFGVLAVTASVASARTWTNDEDQTLEADFVRYRSSDRTVLLRGENGKLVPAPIDRLSEEDQQWVEAYRDFVAPRIWGDPAKRQRGRFQVLRDDHVEVRLASESLSIPLKDLTAEDVAHLEALYAHTEEELPAYFATVKRTAVASRPPDGAVERDWTDAKGRTITALYGGTEGDQAVLWIKGKRYEYPLSRLSAADRTWVGQQKLGQLANDLKGGWSAASTIAMTGMAKAMMEGRTPPTMPPMGQPGMAPPSGNRGAPYSDPRQMASNGFNQPPYDRGYQDPAGTAEASDPSSEVQAYQASESPVDMPPPENAATVVDGAAGDQGRGDPPWISSVDELSGDEYDRRLDEAFASYPEINYDDAYADAYCSHCEGEYVVPVGFSTGTPCPLCGVALAEGDISLLADIDDGDSSGRPWYMSRTLRRLVIGTIVVVIGVGVKLARSGILSGGDEEA
ncbi:hypothetical protein [Botrimarina mediterranea]|uniref:hypothetical protein n=1 Tax=Botrimarina mediterranea TaxID=2528022 RepID=UPI00118A8C98|nr:hypothetical protein K2D_33290 [Planctomycetes bacterium K2D]